ncbi:hypothetical protein [Bradyrhizobium sp. CCBAU 51765]|uniref:hypothetical protein n=1 Tax=Bradyrhizobium sp. CCBAU 51765 TaxID=1325102 RepID=UPI0018897FAF|nr:hypothetical protein [Bradyrhizobium sp. CCBAU 51765]
MHVVVTRRPRFPRLHLAMRGAGAENFDEPDPALLRDSDHAAFDTINPAKID